MIQDLCYVINPNDPFGKPAGNDPDTFEEVLQSVSNKKYTNEERSSIQFKFINAYKELVSQEEYQKEIKSTTKRIETAKDLFEFWEEKRDILAEFYANDLLYQFKDEILENFKGIQRSKKSLTIAIESNPQKNKEILEEVLKELLSKVEEMTKNNDLLSVKRTTLDSGTIYLKTEELNETEIQQLNETLRSILIIHKYLINERDSILTIDNQANKAIKLLYKPLAINAINNDVIDEHINNMLKNPEVNFEEYNNSVSHCHNITEESIINYITQKEITNFTENILRSDNATSKSVLDGVNDFQESLVKFLNNTVIRAYNDIRRIENNFVQTHKNQLYLNFWKELFGQLSEYLEDFLEKIGIEKIPVMLGDDYNPVIHEPVAEAEPDENLKNDQIKFIENEGFRFTDQGVFSDSIPGHRILKRTDVIIVKNN